MDLTALKTKFTELFKQTNMKAFFSPGRINLIGEHTDYNGGNVFPCAITLGTYGLAAKREDQIINFYSENFSELGVISIDLDNLEYNPADKWTNYPKGMIKFLKESDYAINQGLDILYYGNIPNGAGLSSSASIELLTGFIVQILFDLDIDRLELIKTGQRVENDFIGVNSGIMDQFAVGKGEKDTAILLDCNTLDYELIPVVLENQSIVIMNTKKRRELADSKYNERRSECDQALAELQNVLTVSSLGELDEQTFADHQSALSNKTILKRARHAVTENQRTLKAAVALKAGNLEEFGQLMNESHVSLRDDYEVTGPELDAIVQAAWDQPGILGARMTGAGFGGCAIAIAENDKIDNFIDQVGKQYLDQIGYPGEFYIAQISDGPKLLEEESA
ncbi:galactokinase [Carnobacterium sp.]|uniref:galactokinase n=1 Tax=Carnobacterium sp. TaxID=48221 RepID=UPI00388FAC98